MTSLKILIKNKCREDVMIPSFKEFILNQRNILFCVLQNKYRLKYKYKNYLNLNTNYLSLKIIYFLSYKI